MKKQKAEGSGSNNYISKFYFSKDDISISKSIDVITLSHIHPKYENIIHSFLEDNGFFVFSVKKLLKGYFQMKRKYKHKQDIASVEILYDLKDSFRGFPTLLLTIHDLSKELLSLLDGFFRDHGLLPKVSKIELTMDLFAEDIWGLFEFLQSNLHLKYGRTVLGEKYFTTIYLNNIRGSLSKGMEVYLRPKKGPKKYVRMEITLKRQLIKHLGLELTLKNIDSLNLQRFFDFRLLDEKSLLRHLIWKSRFQIGKMELSRKGSGNLVKRLIHDYLYGTIRYDDEKPTDVKKKPKIIVGLNEEELMRKLMGLKQKKDMVDQYNRFLKPLDDLTDNFFQMLSQGSFIPSRPGTFKKGDFKKGFANAPKGQQTEGLSIYVLSKKPIVTDVERKRLPLTKL